MTSIQLQVDVREDEEQQQKFQQCLDLLLAAGYFRARIRGLSPFDKLVGGMVWCIEMCSIDVDVDLFYKDELSIGQKIAVTERIIEVLPQLSCPRRVEPHQIQGLDCVHIFPVMQWLVKKALENQEETIRYTVGHGVHQFNRRHPQLVPRQPAADLILLRRAEERLREPARPPTGQTPDTTHKEVPEPAVPSLQPAEQAVSVILGTGEITRAARAYEEQTRQLQESGLQPAQHGRQMAALSARLADTERRMVAVSERYSNVRQRHSDLLQERAALDADVAQVDLEEAELTAELDPHQLCTLEDISSSFLEADAILTEDQAFKEKCKTEYVKLQDEISQLQLQAGSAADSDPDTERQVQQQTAEVDHLRSQVAIASRQVALLERQLDDVPSRAEIGQYQKRFVELYNQVSSTHKEAKEYYATNNMLSDTLRYLKNELSLLQSVAESYRVAANSERSRAEFLTQLDGVVLNINSNQKKVLAKKQEEKWSLDEFRSRLDELKALARTYHSVLKEFRDECAANEALTAHQDAD